MKKTANTNELQKEDRLPKLSRRACPCSSQWVLVEMAQPKPTLPRFVHRLSLADDSLGPHLDGNTPPHTQHIHKHLSPSAGPVPAQAKAPLSPAHDPKSTVFLRHHVHANFPARPTKSFPSPPLVGTRLCLDGIHAARPAVSSSSCACPLRRTPFAYPCQSS